jgi:ribosome modulation factor
MAGAPSVNSWQVRGDGAWANGWGGDECVSVGVDIGGNEQTVHQKGGAPVTENAVWGGIWMSNWCTGTETYGWGWVSPAGFSASLTSASASISFEAYSYQWTVDPVTGEWSYVDLGTSTVSITASWTGFGDTIKGMSHNVSRWGTYFNRSRWSGQWREATVVLSATVDGAPVTLLSSYGNLGKFNNGGTDIYSY